MKKCGVLFFTSSAVALVIAYVSQLGFGLVPCKLCLYERIPYFVSIVPALIMVLKGYRSMFYVVTASYLVGALISGYHAGLEYGWFSDFLHCAGDVKLGASLEDVRSSLLSKEEVVSCKVPSLVFLGLSLSGWNAVYIILCLFIAFCFARGRK
ncbi:disulfide bond formation protein B [Candidatus Anaplasma sp. TIGMIC]|uniref:disulfide bond formation protein B n=1 Tax=Candidatus Anaplasma sp. TIGMIC TaxID=3020713 RepID=UPI00232DB295|nr:disulfide bond formation protein B [Candidatus Anaplasma sp. TIGMIC]MDB1135063.1 disulfide bond formation protein B [Candidatus Anaplasma sp. TIGMIC]